MFDEQTVTLITIGVVVIFALIQWFLAVRPWFIWGLVLPLMFGLIWYLLASPPSFLPFDAIFDEAAIAYFIQVSRLGLLASAAVFVLCRIVMLLRKSSKNRQRDRRMEEKRLRQAQFSSLKASYGLEDESPAAADTPAAAVPEPALATEALPAEELEQTRNLADSR